MGSLDCFRNVLQMEMAWPRQKEGLAPASSTGSREVRRTPPVLGVSLRTKNTARGKMLKCAKCLCFKLRNFHKMSSPAANIGFSTWNSLKLNSTSRWLGASHSDSQKNVPCAKILQWSQILCLVLLNFDQAVHPNSGVDCTRPRRTAVAQRRWRQKGSKGPSLKITHKSVPYEKCCGLSKLRIQGWEISTRWPTRTLRPAPRDPAAPC